MTLEKFIKDVAEEYPRGGLVWRDDPSRYPSKVWVIMDNFGDEGVPQSDYAREWEDLTESFYNGPTVTERAHATKVLAALRQWREAKDAEVAAHEAWTNAANRPPITKYIDDWNIAKARLEAAWTILRSFDKTKGES